MGLKVDLKFGPSLGLGSIKMKITKIKIISGKARHDKYEKDKWSTIFKTSKYLNDHELIRLKFKYVTQIKHIVIYNNKKRWLAQNDI